MAEIKISQAFRILSLFLVGPFLLLSTSCSDGYVPCSQLQRDFDEIESLLDGWLESGSVAFDSDEWNRQLYEMDKISIKADEQSCTITID